MVGKKIGVIGAGKLGLSFALLCEHNGITVWASDINKDYIESLKDKTFKSVEPYIQEYLHESNNLHPTTDNFDVIRNTDIIFTFVPTPSVFPGGYDHKYVDEVVESIVQSTKEGVDVSGKTLVIGCTTNPGYSQTVEEKLKPYGVSVCYNPEFIAQGNIISGLRFSDFILLGASNKETFRNVREIYYSITTEPTFKEMSLTAAEITKISVNCFLTTKISFANMIGEVCHNSNISDEVSTVLDAIGEDSRIGKKFLNYGFGFGGPCLPRDNRALSVYAESVGLDLTLPKAVDEFNIEHHKYLVNKFVMENPNRNTTFVFNSVTYKKGTDQLTESQQLNLLLSLLAEGYSCIVIDIDEVIEKLEGPLTKTYGEKIKFQPIGTMAEGVKIIL